MACARSPPASPRAPKIQQQSWDDCGTPPIDLFDPNQRTPPRSPSRNMDLYEHQPPKSPRSPRQFDKNINVNYYEQKSPKSPRKFDFVASDSPKFEYTEEHFDDEVTVNSSQNMRNYQMATQNSNNYYYDQQQQQQQQTPIKSPKKPRKFEYGAISPKHENKGQIFEYTQTMEHEEDSSYVDHRRALIQYKKKRVYNKSPDGVVSLDEYNSNNYHHKKRNSVVAESTISGDSEVSSAATTALCSNNSNSGHGGDAENSSDGGNGGPIIATRCGRRRHAINITSNPGYQAIHNSHSTLDRTCSDSVVSLRCRKSTSDLTESNECTTPTNKVPYRRGSSKGGLAYLASRRGSRDSIKSAVSNASIFSNEDIGPLAFQASTRGRQRRTSNFLELPVPDHARPRVCSLPERPYNPRQSDDLYRLRTFSISKGTVVNCGDSIISRRSRSNTSVNSTTSRASERSPFECCGGGYATVDSMPGSPDIDIDDFDEPPPPPRYRVVMLGDSGVGKTALVSQFMTSEYMHTYDASLDDEFGEKTVSILLDGEESEMVFIDHPTVEMSVENSLSTYEPHACVVVYSIVTKNSFRVAEEILNYLWRENVTKDKAVIVVGNKADLARSRVISTAEGKQLAASRDTKFIETSSGIQHNVDELLVGVLKQIRLKETREKKALSCATKMKNSRTHLSLHLAKEILQKICLSDISKSKSCENLHVL